jgi:hypothetical protein
MCPCLENDKSEPANSPGIPRDGRYLPDIAGPIGFLSRPLAGMRNPGRSDKKKKALLWGTPLKTRSCESYLSLNSTLYVTQTAIG